MNPVARWCKIDAWKDRTEFGTRSSGKPCDVLHQVSHKIDGEST
jgi:hypothetical protein